MTRIRFRNSSVCFALWLVIAGSSLMAERFAVLPQIAVGGGWSFEVFVNNQGVNEAADLEIAFFDDDGNPLEVESAAGMIDRLSFALAPGETRVLSATRRGAARAGYAVLRTPTESSVRSTLVLRFAQGARVITGVGLAQAFPFLHHSFPAEVDAARGVNTGMALANPVFDSSTPRAQTFIVSLIREDGARVGITKISLRPGGHTSMFLDDPRAFPDIGRFKGTVAVSAPLPHGVLALRLDDGVLSSVAVNIGPVLAPYTLGDPTMAEQEPNSPSSAQEITLPAVIEGTISEPRDLDVFSFAANSGDILSVLVDTDSITSDLDSNLILTGPDGETISQNDQTGLLRDNDSFLQVELPETGTYSIAVGDFFFRGGSRYRYRLHIGMAGQGPPVQIPQLTSMSPLSGAQGSVVSLTVNGYNLQGATGLNVSPPDGITVSGLNSSANQVTATLTIDQGATPGPRQVSVTTPTGTSESRTFTVDPAGGASLDGSWSGTTGQGMPVSMTVENNEVKRFKFKVRIQGFGCTSTLEAELQTSRPIVNNSFNISTSGRDSFTIDGTFTSSSTVGGTLRVTLGSIPGVPSCPGSISTSWTASK